MWFFYRHDTRLIVAQERLTNISPVTFKDLLLSAPRAPPPTPGVGQKTIRCLRIPLPCSLSLTTPFLPLVNFLPHGSERDIILFLPLLYITPSSALHIWKDAFCCPCGSGVSQWTSSVQNRVLGSLLGELSPQLAPPHSGSLCVLPLLGKQMARTSFSHSQECQVFVCYHLSITWSFTSQVFPLHLATLSSTPHARHP